MNNKIDISVRYNLSELLLPFHVEDLKTNNIYKGKTLTEIKEYMYYDKKMEKDDSLIPILIYIRNIKDFLNLLTQPELTRLEEILEETKDSEPLEEWMFS